MTSSAAKGNPDNAVARKAARKQRKAARTAKLKAARKAKRKALVYKQRMVALEQRMAASNEIDELKVEVKDLKAKNETLVGDNKELKAKSEELLSKKKELKAKVKASESEKNELKAKVKELEASENELKAKNEALENEIKDLKVMAPNEEHRCGKANESGGGGGGEEEDHKSSEAQEGSRGSCRCPRCWRFRDSGPWGHFHRYTDNKHVCDVPDKEKHPHWQEGKKMPRMIQGKELYFFMPNPRGKITFQRWERLCRMISSTITAKKKQKPKK